MRILFVVKNLRVANGVSSYVMNYYRKIKERGYNIDFLLINDAGSPYYDEITNNNDNVYILPSYKKNLFKVIKFLCNIFEKNNYDIIHSNVVNSGSLILFLAKIKGIRIRILQSHATQVGDGIIKRIRNIPFKKVAIKNSNVYFACSELAGRDLFKNKKFYVINNAIDINKFKYNKDKEMYLRKKMNLDSEKNIIAVGRITKQKNPFFIVDVVKELVKKDSQYKLLWLGSGDLNGKIEKYIAKNHLENNIILLGSVINVDDYYNIGDIFILPSIYEGLPVVGIEAQISGLYCFFSDKITREVALGNNNCKFLSIKSHKKWADEIYNLKYSRLENINEIDYSQYIIENQAEKLISLYKELIEKKGENDEM